MRQIAFLAHRLEKVTFAADARTHEITDVQRERYAEMRRELETYGTVVSSRTSGVMSRVSTPPEGILVTQSDREAHERRGRIRTQHALLDVIEKSQVLVAAIDGESETRGSLIEHAHALRKGVLLLQQYANIHIFRPMYENREGIDFVVYRDAQEMRLALRRFFNRYPVQSYG